MILVTHDATVARQARGVIRIRKLDILLPVGLDLSILTGSVVE
jgi:ABC-type lipoprotein export system ATPase subunit